MKVLLIGFGNINKLIKENSSVEVVGVVTRNEKFINDTPEVIIDFSHPAFLKETVKYAQKYKCAVIIGTTGYTLEEENIIKELSNEVSVLMCENFSFGINLIQNMIEKNISSINKFQKNIYETHRLSKVDIPSGTAIKLSNILDTKTIISYRIENVLGKHKIVLSNQYEKIEIIHEILDRRVFSNNVLLVAKKLLCKEVKLYKFEELLNE